MCVPIIFFTSLVLSHNLAHPTYLSIPIPVLNSSFDLNFISAVALAYASYFILLEPVAGVSPGSCLVGSAVGPEAGHMTDPPLD